MARASEGSWGSKVAKPFRRGRFQTWDFVKKSVADLIAHVGQQPAKQAEINHDIDSRTGMSSLACFDVRNVSYAVSAARH